ncbi:MAG: hypothetical protein PG981_000154 [Wolbachia endosymbiont of Ctenocephalides orientis wCori]|nr:MAG: hypothetical protein PG981_000154 [Wolbachia endosymbiont of Ctenocephalides orientis wCori]
MGIFHNVLGDHDAEIQVVSDQANKAFGIATSVSDKVTSVSSDVIDLSDRVTALSNKFTKFTNLPEKLPTDFSEQALQAAEMAGDSDKIMLICAVVITFLACAVLFTALCAYLGNRTEQNREENQNLLPGTGMNSSRASSVSDLTLETQVKH